jgi:hypothetical protein
MPGQNMSKFIGTSPSPSIERVIKNNTNNQQEVKVPAVANNGQYNKEPVTDLSKK